MGGARNIAASISAFSEGAQHNRLMRMDFPMQDGPHAILLANTLRAHEEVSRGFRFEVEVLSDDARIPLKALMARMVTVCLVRTGGSLRYFNGYVTDFRFLRTDGGFAFYQMVLEPWLAFARLRQDNISFHGKTLREITESTLKNYRQADWHMHTYDNDPAISVANQHNETDYNHLHRRWEARGMHYWYEHREDGHTLMLSDKSWLNEPIDVDRNYDADIIAFHAESGSRDDDGIHRWSPSRRLGAGRTTIASFDYKNPTPQLAHYDSENRQGDFFAYEIYENAGAYGFPTRIDGEQLAQQKMVSNDSITQTFDADSNARTVQPGRTFRLGGHFSAEPRSKHHDPEPRGSIEDRRYLILSVDHQASNNYQAGATAPSHYQNSFTCIRHHIRWQSRKNYHSLPCANPGVQTAIVVGPAGSEIYTDGLGRIKVQFHWDRLGTRDENSSPWIRVMTPGAGGQFGHIRLPRVGEEVVVVFMDGNIDRPLIIGGLYNGTHLPPWDLPGQSTLSGLRSRELGNGVQANHLAMDDTPGKIQVQLKSDHQCSQLSLGHLTRIDDHRGRKDERGEGFELRTDAWGVVRAAKGILITTEERKNASGRAKDMADTVGRLHAASDLHQQLDSVSQMRLAKNSNTEQHSPNSALKEQIESIQGRGRSSELSEPQLLLASQAGIASSSNQSTHIQSNRHTVISSGEDFSVATGKSFLAKITERMSLFVYKAGMQFVAAKGKVEIQAQSDNVEIIAEQVLKLISTKKSIEIGASQEILLHAGGSFIRVNAKGIQQGCNGKWETHAANHSFEGPQNLELSFAAMPAGELGPHSLRFAFPGADNMVAALGKVGKPYRIVDKAGKELAVGTVPHDGRMPRLDIKESDLLTLELGDKNWRHARVVPSEQIPERAEIKNNPYHDGRNFEPPQFEENFGPYASEFSKDQTSHYLSGDLLKRLISNPKGEQ